MGRSLGVGGGRSQLRWEDCVKRDVRKAEENDRRREKAAYREKWKEKTPVSVQQCGVESWSLTATR